jgi:SpoVK/Ycf46/Vps4 family AAA+-type ATPase
VGGLHEQIRELREVIELPLTNPELFARVGIKPPKGVLLYGPPGTGKTLLARALACNMNATFIKVVASAIVDKYIGESARMIREMFGYARDHAPTVIFMDEIDAIGGRRDSGASSADREIQRTLMELLNQLDGFEALDRVKIVMATNRPDILDPALLRPGRLDRKIEIPLPNDAGRLDILKIHASTIAKKGDIDWEAVVKLAEGFNGADMRNVCTEAGMYAIRDDRDFVVENDFMQAARKTAEFGLGDLHRVGRHGAGRRHLVGDLGLENGLELVLDGLGQFLHHAGDLADLGLLVEVDGELLEGAFAALLVAFFRLGRIFFRLFAVSRALGWLGFGLAGLGDAVADERNRIQPRHVLLLQEEHRMAFAFGKQRDQHVGAGHFLAA